MGRRVLMGMALVMAASAAHAAEPLYNVPISVQVVDEAGRAVSGGRVRFAGAWVGESVKDGWAQQVRETLAPGVHQVAYVGDGLLAVRRVRVRETDQSVTATIRLGEEPVAGGQVLATDGKPLPDVEIDIQAIVGRSPLGGSCKSDGAGKFRVDGFCLDGATALARNPGFAESERQRIIEPFPVALRFTLVREGAISLTILAADGTPLSDAYCAASTVNARQKRIVGGLLTSNPNEPGRAEIRFVEPGKVRVVAYAPWYDMQVREVEVREGERAGDLEFRLNALPTVAIKGIVVGPDGTTPVPGARVGLVDLMERMKASHLMLTGGWSGGYSGHYPRATCAAVTDVDGRFGFRAPTGPYDGFVVSAEGYADYRPVTAIPFEVTRPLYGLRFQLFRGGRIEGAVRTPDGGLPPAGTRASLYLTIGKSAGMGRQAEVSPETGAFVLEHVRAGRATLTVTFPDHGAASAEFEVSEGGVVRPALRFLPEARIIGRVVDRRNGTPLAMASVEAYGQNTSEMREAITEDDGTFELSPMTAGKAWLSVALPRYASLRQTVDTAGGGLHEITLDISPGGRVEGRLSEALLASPERPAWVGLGARLESVARAQLDQAGHFVMTHVAPGSYVLVAGPSPMEMDAAEPQEVTVAEGETTRVVVEGK